MSKELKSVLSHYRLFTPVLKQYGKVTKVYTATGTYALKEANFSQENLRSFQVGDQQFYKSVPVVLTSTGQRYFMSNNRVYYLTPWMAERKLAPIEKIKAMLEDVAVAHKKTADKVPFHSQWKRNYQYTLERSIISAQATIERYIAIAEKQEYMSPFHYLFCGYFPSWMADINRYNANLQRWKELIQPKKEIRLVLTHGKLSSDHFLCTTNGNYFLNVENIHWNVPQFDLVNVCQADDLRENHGEVFDLYDRYFPLEESEKFHLALHLLSLQPIISVIKKYEKKGYAHEIEAVRALQQAQISCEAKFKYANHLLQESEKQSHV
jgi:spore coat protein YsxE